MVELHLDRRDHHEAGPVLLLVGNVTGDHLEARELGSLLAGDRSLGEVASLTHRTGRRGGVLEGDRLDTVERPQENRALLQRLRVGEDFPQGIDLDACVGGETVPNLQDLLADNLELGAPQQFVGLVDGAGGGVLDWQEGVARAAGLGLLEGRGEGRAADELDLRGLGREVLSGRDVAVGSLDALKRHAVRTLDRLLGPIAFEQRFLLRFERHRDELAEDLLGAKLVDAELARPALHPAEELGFTLMVAQERQPLGLEAGDLRDRPQPFVEDLDQPPVDPVEVAAQFLELFHGYHQNVLPLMNECSSVPSRSRAGSHSESGHATADARTQPGARKSSPGHRPMP